MARTNLVVPSGVAPICLPQKILRKASTVLLLSFYRVLGRLTTLEDSKKLNGTQGDLGRCSFNKKMYHICINIGKEITYYLFQLLYFEKMNYLPLQRTFILYKINGLRNHVSKTKELLYSLNF